MNTDDGWEESTGGGGKHAYHLWTKTLSDVEYARIVLELRHPDEYKLYISEHYQETGECIGEESSLEKAKAYFAEREREAAEEEAFWESEDNE